MKNKKHIIITLSVVIALVIVVGLVLLIQKISLEKEREKELNSVVIELKEKEIEIEYGKIIDANEYINKFEGGELNINNGINFERIGTYEVEYKVITAKGAEKLEVMIVKVMDTTLPDITLNKDKITVKLNDSVNMLSGVTAKDNYDGNISEKITTSGTVNTKKVGTYKIKYDVKDSSGNSAKTKTRTYIVEDPNALIIGKTYAHTYSSMKKLDGYRCRIILRKSNKVDFYSDFAFSETDQFAGTYKINNNKLTITITGYYETYGNKFVKYSKPIVSTYTIINKNQFKDSTGAIYK